MGHERVEVWKEPECVEGVPIAPEFGAIVRSERLAGTMRSCLEAGGTIAVARRGAIVCGYATVVPSTTHVLERWRDLPDCQELGALEVVRPARRRRLAQSMLEELSRAMPIEELILFARGFISHWDLLETGLPALSYRRMLVGLLGRFGLAHEETDDPEVVDHPMNFLSVRYGRRVSASSLYAFGRCLRAAS